MRVYQGDSLDGKPLPHTFVEVESGKFLEVDLPQLDGIDKGSQQRLRAFTRRIRAEEKKNNTYHIRLHKRYFSTIYPVPNLRLVGEF